MKAHDLEAVGSLKLNYTPNHPDHAARLQDVTSMVGGVASPVFVTDVVALDGNIGDKTYAVTIPANQVVLSCVSDTQNIRIYFLAESGIPFYNPTITVNGEVPDSFVESAGDRRLYEGYADIVVTESGDVTLNSSTSAVTVVNITLNIDGPEIATMVIGTLPNSQTEVKSGDLVPVSGTVANDAVSIGIENSKVASGGNISLGAIDSAGAGFRSFTGTATVSGRNGSLAIDAYAYNTLGTPGDLFTSGTSITLNQTYPSIGTISILYNNGFSGLDLSDVATVDATVTNADQYAYSFDHGTVSNASAYDQGKSVTCTADTVYDESNNYTITATKTSNGATTVKQAAVVVASADANISIAFVGNPSRLRSSPTGESHILELQSDQAMLITPSGNPSSGSFIGGWLLNGNNWRRNLQVDDADPKGAATVADIAVLNKAGKPSNIVSNSYVVGGFVSRTITFAQFAQESAIGTVVVDNAKTVARYAGALDDLVLQANVADVVGGYTLTDGAAAYQSAGGTHLFISDVAYAGANTSGTLQLEIEEYE